MKKNIRNNIFITVIGLLLTYCSSYEEKEVRHIIPPKLDGQHIGKKILCYRPMRHGSPALNIETRNRENTLLIIMDMVEADGR